jgi:hypothetical protein
VRPVLVPAVRSGRLSAAEGSALAVVARIVANINR